MANNEPGKPSHPQDQQQPAAPDAAARDAAAEEAAFAELMEAAAEEAPPSRPPSSSAVNLGHSPQEPRSAPSTPAGESSFPWESLVQEPATPGEPSPPKFDSPSDVEVLRHAEADLASKEEEETLSTTTPPPPESSRVDLAESGQPEDLFATGNAPKATDSDVRVVEAEPDSGVEIESAAEVVSIDSGIDIGTSGVEVGAEPSAVDLSSQPSAHPEEDSSSIDLGVTGAALIDDSASGIDLEGAVIVEDVSSGIDLGSESGSEPAVSDSSMVMLSSREEVALPEEDSRSDVFVGADVPPAEGSPSFAASGIDLGEGIAPPAPPPEGESGMALEPPQAAEEEAAGASSVNLSAALAGPGSSRDLIAEAVESGVDLGRAAEAVESAEDLEDVILMPPSQPEPSDSVVDLGAPMPSEEEAVSPLLSAASGQLEQTREWQPGDALELGAAMSAAAAAASERSDVFEPGQVLEGPGAEEVVEGGQSVTITVDAEAEAERAAAGVETVMEGGVPVTITVDEQAEAERAAPAALRGAKAPRPVKAAAETKEAETAAGERGYPRPKYGRRWVGGALIGTVVGIAACVAVAMFIPETWQKLTGMKEAKSDKAGPGKGGTKAPPVDLGKLAENGDFATEAPPADANNAPALAARGEYVWLQYLHKTPQPKESDPAVQQALADLQKAAALKDPDGYYWQGDIYETLGKFKEARAIYQQAATVFKDQPEVKARFDAVLNRLDFKEADKATAPAATSRLPARLDVTRLALLLIALQAPTPKDKDKPAKDKPGEEKPPKGDVPPPQQTDLPEAGFAFWKALRLAQQQNFAEAAKALAEARKEHEARRLTRLRKPQNPRSDPREEIFLRACDQLTAYFQLQDRLRSGGYLNLTDKKDPVKAVSTALADLKTAREEGATLKKDYDKLKDDKKAADDKIALLEKDLDKSKKETKAALAEVADRETKLKKAAADFKAQGEKLVAATMRGDRLAADKKNLEKTIGEVGDRLKLKGLDPMAGQAVLLKKLDDMLDIANTKDPMGRLMATMLEVRQLKGTLAQRWTPQTMLGYWSSFLADRGQKALAEAAVRDVERVRADTAATPAAKAEALAVEGLALRNRGEFARARTALEMALKAEAPEKAPWQEIARQALKELTDPAAYYLPRAEALRSQGRYDQALAMLDEALKVFPENNGQLLVQRSLTRLDTALQAAKGGLKPDAIKEAQADAEAAIKAGSVAPGNYVAGRIAEALGKRDAAADAYRKAIAAAPAASPEAAEYKLALARVLLGAPAEAKRVSRLPSVKELLVLMLVGVQPPTPEELALEEANKLADEVLARKDIDKFPLLKAQALAVKGLWTRALNSYVDGLQLHLSRELMAGLRYIVENHPMQRRPDRMTVAQPMQGEKFYGIGLNRFFARDYAGAEQEFIRALENFDRDARYHYFLGLARLQQRKRGAAEDFEQAAKLELQGWPSRAAVDASLERIQGRPRDLINEARNRVR
jgi:tetratricopeptide (TPR) repeat protein